MRHNANRCTDNLWRTSTGRRPPEGQCPSPASAR
jgi:hypothetical protein